MKVYQDPNSGHLNNVFDVKLYRFELPSNANERDCVLDIKLIDKGSIFLDHELTIYQRTFTVKEMNDIRTMKNRSDYSKLEISDEDILSLQDFVKLVIDSLSNGKVISFSAIHNKAVFLGIEQPSYRKEPRIGSCPWHILCIPALPAPRTWYQLQIENYFCY
eukprot:324747_1